MLNISHLFFLVLKIGKFQLVINFNKEKYIEQIWPQKSDWNCIFSFFFRKNVLTAEPIKPTIYFLFPWNLVWSSDGRPGRNRQKWADVLRYIHFIGSFSWANGMNFQCHLPRVTQDLFRVHFLQIGKLKDQPFLRAGGTQAKRSAKYGPNRLYVLLLTDISK